ncbi:MAG: tyrosine--tRNA ligase [Acidobacteriota bacterium]
MTPLQSTKPAEPLLLSSVDEQLTYLTKGCVDVVRVAELRSKLERAKTTGRPLTVKVGFDPTAPDLHLGHTVLIRKMRHFQDLGHRVVFVVGDFTAMIGDPSGRSRTRPALSRDAIDENAETYKTQAFKILDRDRTVLELNSRWLGPLGAEGLIRLAGRYNVAQMLERRDFRQRFDARQPIAIHEFLYPLAQAYDSVFLEADVELGGTDQLFNLNVGRDIMPGYGLEAQVVMTTPLLEGMDGVEKMSKSFGNYIGVSDSSDEMYGKVMSISDELMWRYYLLLSDMTAPEIDATRAAVTSGATHPKQVKIDLATRLVTDFHSAAEAVLAAERFERRARGESTGDEAILESTLADPPRAMRHLLIELKLAGSGREADQKIDQGAVAVDGTRVASKFDLQTLYLRHGAEHRLTIGRRAYRLRVT